MEQGCRIHKGTTHNCGPECKEPHSYDIPGFGTIFAVGPKPKKEQPLPTQGKQSVTDELIAFLRQRQEKGVATYGRSLETFNGRDAKRDALEESLDLNQYLFQMYLEEKAERERYAVELNELRAGLTEIISGYSGGKVGHYHAFDTARKLLGSK